MGSAMFQYKGLIVLGVAFDDSTVILLYLTRSIGNTCPEIDANFRVLMFHEERASLCLQIHLTMSTDSHSESVVIVLQYPEHRCSRKDSGIWSEATFGSVADTVIIPADDKEPDCVQETVKIPCFKDKLVPHQLDQDKSNDNAQVTQASLVVGKQCPEHSNDGCTCDRCGERFGSLHLTGIKCQCQAVILVCDFCM